MVTDVYAGVGVREDTDSYAFMDKQDVDVEGPYYLTC